MSTRSTSAVKSHFAAGAVGLLLGIGIVATTPSSADAYVPSGCKFSPGSIDPISWRYYSVGSVYVTASNHGFAAWNSTATDGYFEQQSLSFDPEVSVTDDPYNNNLYAWWTYSCSAGLYSGNEGTFVWNTTNSAGRSVDQKKRIATHELGHAYGLDHVGSGAAAGCRIMRTDVGTMTDCTITYPAADDIAGANTVN